MGQMNCDDTYIETVVGTGVGWRVRSVNPLSRTTHPAYVVLGARWTTLNGPSFVYLTRIQTAFNPRQLKSYFCLLR